MARSIDLGYIGLPTALFIMGPLTTLILNSAHKFIVKCLMHFEIHKMFFYISIVSFYTCPEEAFEPAWHFAATEYKEYGNKITQQGIVNN